MTVKEVLDDAEKTIDAIEEQLDILESGVEVVKGTRLVVGTMVVAGIAAGAAITYLIAKKKLEKKYSELSKKEIAETREYYNRMTKPASPAELAARYSEQKDYDEVVAQDPPEDELEELRSITKSYQSDDIVKAKEKIQDKKPDILVVQNIFQNSKPSDNDDFDYEEEESQRSEEHPYILSHEEFMACEKDYQQTSLTYYEGDDVLTDDKDQPIEDTNNTVGDANLLRFGHGSRDNNILYVRNDRLTLEFEIVRSQNKYVEQVLGFIEHSARDRRPRRFRSDDD